MVIQGASEGQGQGTQAGAGQGHWGISSPTCPSKEPSPCTAAYSLSPEPLCRQAQLVGGLTR